MWPFMAVLWSYMAFYGRFNVVKNLLLQSIDLIGLEANQNKNNCLVRNILDRLKFPAFFSVRNRWEKRAGDFNLSKKLLTRQLFLFWFAFSRGYRFKFIWSCLTKLGSRILLHIWIWQTNVTCTGHGSRVTWFDSDCVSLESWVAGQLNANAVQHRWPLIYAYSKRLANMDNTQQIVDAL